MGSVVAVLAVVGVAQLLAPLRVSGRKPEAEELARAHALVLREGAVMATWPSLATSLCCFIPAARRFDVRRRGQWLDRNGDPIGQPELIEELLWQFRELCDQHDASPVFYQVSARYLPLYLELGLIPFKLGRRPSSIWRPSSWLAAGCATCARAMPRASGRAVVRSGGA